MTHDSGTVRPGFTLLELLTVLAVIGIVVGLLLSAVQSVRAAAARAACANHLRQIGLGCHHYHDVETGLPAAYARYPARSSRGVLTWTTFILPYIEQEALWRLTLDAHRSDWISFHNPPHVGLTTVLKVYTCPADGRLSAPITDEHGVTAAYGSYLGVAGGTTADGAMRADTGVRLTDITYGTSGTLMMGERPPEGRLLGGNWYTIMVPPPTPAVTYGAGIDYLVALYPYAGGGCSPPIRFGPGRTDNRCDDYHFWSLHPGGANFAFADGSVRFLRYSAADVLPALATRAGGEVVAVPD